MSRDQRASTRKTSSPAAHTIAAAFARPRAEGRAALVPAVRGGDLAAATSEEVAVALCQAGADVLELGVPCSDPLADGVTIQAAAQHALEGGMTLAGTLALAGCVAARVETPLVLMG